MSNNQREIKRISWLPLERQEEYYLKLLNECSQSEDSDFNDDSDENFLPCIEPNEYSDIDDQSIPASESASETSDSEDSHSGDANSDSPASASAAEFSESNNTRSGEENNDCLPGISGALPQILFGRQKKEAERCIWSTNAPNPANRTPSHNIIRGKTGAHKSSCLLSEFELFRLFFSEEMCSIIVRETNRKALIVYTAINAKNPTKPPKLWSPLTLQELYAYIGVLITAGVHHSNNEHVAELWKLSSLPIFRATMGITRFLQINRFLRFDNNITRAFRMKDDKAAPIRDLWEMMNANLHNNYKPNECITIDEQLFPYRGRTKFTQYIPSKPSKYGIKIWWACDSKTSYPLKGEIYTGKPANGLRETQVGSKVVKRLVKSFERSGRNITMDNFFTSEELADYLLSKNLTLVGTLRMNKPTIPKEMLKSKTRPINSSIFGFSGRKTIVSYVPKKDKAVVLLSTMHHDKSVSGDDQKPEIIRYYNGTKGGVDVMDKMLTHFTTKRSTKRWPVALFFNILDVCALAAYIIHSEHNTAQKTDSRRKFLQELGRQLCMPSIHDRSQNALVYRNFNTKNGIEAMIGAQVGSFSTRPKKTAAERDPDGRLSVQGSCYICSQQRKPQRKTRKCCNYCEKPICQEHNNTVNMCDSCSQNI